MGTTRFNEVVSSINTCLSVIVYSVWVKHNASWSKLTTRIGKSDTEGNEAPTVNSLDDKLNSTRETGPELTDIIDMKKEQKYFFDRVLARRHKIVRQTLEVRGKQISTCEEVIANIKVEYSLLNEELNKLQGEINVQEQYSHCNNSIICGIPEDKFENLHLLIKHISNLIDFTFLIIKRNLRASVLEYGPDNTFNIIKLITTLTGMIKVVMSRYFRKVWYVDWWTISSRLKSSSRAVVEQLFSLVGGLVDDVVSLVALCFRVQRLNSSSRAVVEQVFSLVGGLVDDVVSLGALCSRVQRLNSSCRAVVEQLVDDVVSLGAFCFRVPRLYSRSRLLFEVRVWTAMRVSSLLLPIMITILCFQVEVIWACLACLVWYLGRSDRGS
ncbi:hypothetical protein J6590_089120 [Homalodisca vitripennis]|nr:hypothetical protein J6590_089120 [Homalodisca vitripennis]